MRLVGLISGGKDSMYNLLQCVAAGHEIVALANIEPEEKDELDSFMYQSVGHQLITLLSGALALPLYRIKTKGEAHCTSKTYIKTDNDEVEDLTKLLSNVYGDIQIDGVAVGAVLSDYQRTRVENVCSRLKLKCFAYLWKRDQFELLDEMIEVEMHAIIIKIAAIGLDPNLHLGKTIADIRQHLKNLNKQYGVSVVGEGGEYETFTLDCPLFHRMIVIKESETVLHSNDAFAPVAYMNAKSAYLDDKEWGNVDPLSTITRRLQKVSEKVHDPIYYIRDVISTNEVPVITEDEDTHECEDLSKHYVESSLSLMTGPSQCSSIEKHPTMKNKVLLDFSSFHVNLSNGWGWIGNVTASSPASAFKIAKKHIEFLDYSTKDLVSVTMFIKSMNDYNTVNKWYEQLFITESSEPPVRACVATCLPEDTKVLLELVLHKKPSEDDEDGTRDTMYVRSWSHWAPANIGPYSQCVTIKNIVYVCGQIPLVPGTMELLSQPIQVQFRLVLRHVLRILEGNASSCRLQHIMLAICYLTNKKDLKHVQATWNNNETAAKCYVVVESLPKDAEVELQVMACSLSLPLVESGSNLLLDCFNCTWYRSYQIDEKVFAISYNLSFKEITTDQNDCVVQSHILIEDLIEVIKDCAQLLLGIHDVSLTVQPCSLKIFYKVPSIISSSLINNAINIVNTNEIKIVTTAIPVVNLVNNSIFLSIAGLSH